MKSFLPLLLSFALPSFAMATLQQLPFPEIKCRDELLTQLDSWHVTGDWKAQPILTPGQPVFVAATETLGAWAQIQLTPDHTVFATLIKDGKQTGTRWHMEASSSVETHAPASLSLKCVSEESHASKKIFHDQNGFTDADLAKLFEKNPKGGLILEWTPSMDYSQRAVKAASDAATQLGLPLEILVDSDASADAAKKIAREQRLPASVKMNRSLDLYMRGMEQHFPSFIAYADGKFSRPMLPGLMTTEGYVAFVKEGSK